MSDARLVSIQVGKPTTYGAPGASDPLDLPWRTGFFKSPVAGPVWLGLTNVAGDGQANRKVHGGPDKAVLAYAARHYQSWRAELGRSDFPYGAFAENFTIDGLDESTVCLGDIYVVGNARVQVSQPRQPCSNVSHRWRIEDLTRRVEVTGRTGWYMRVLTEGYVEAGQDVRLVERTNPEWTIERATAAMRQRSAARAEAAALAAVASLSEAWRRTLTAVAVA